MADPYHLVIIGAGSVGLTAARFGSQLGLKVALVGKGRLGGDCTWTGCVPSKTILRAAQAAHQILTAQRFGIGTGGLKTDWGRLIAHVYPTYSMGNMQTAADIETGRRLNCPMGAIARSFAWLVR
jgi:pyruvate/2-oxoglutarate dehydrogenase complex dihydrolipoamide dehydrogenase (E3) component